MDFWIATSWRGSRTIEAPTPIDRIGVFLRAGACIPAELAPSLIPGDSMSSERVRAVIAIKAGSTSSEHVRAAGAQYVLLYGIGSKQVIPVDLKSEFVTLLIETKKP